MNRELIIYHDGCPDGFGAAYMIVSLLDLIAENQGVPQRETTLHPMKHGQTPPPVSPDEYSRVWLLDFANVPADWLIDAFTRMPSVIVLDHHQTAEHVFEKMLDVEIGCLAVGWSDDLIECQRLFVLDQLHSGVGLAALYLGAHGFDPDRILPVWRQLEDRDLWRFRLTGTEDVFAAVTSRPFTLEAWDEIAETDISALRNEGEAIQRFRDQLITACAENTFELFLRGVEGPILCASAPYAIGSDLGNVLAGRSPNRVGAYAIHKGNEVQIGLRSLENGPDVAEIAEIHGGGGHKHASGLTLPSQDFEDFTA